MDKYSWALALALVGTTSAAQQPSGPACEAVVHVGAWNIQWLGNATAGKRTPQAPKDIAGYISTSKVAVLALSEITATHSAPDANPRNRTLDEAFGSLNDSGGKWKYHLFDKRQGARDPQDQWTGLAWNEAVVTPAGGPWKLEAQIDAQREAAIRSRIAGAGPEPLVLNRWPRAMKFSAGAGLTDFVVVPVHLKSNIGGSATAEARAYEVELMLAGLEKLKAVHADQDIVILGDTNMLRSNELAGLTFVESGFKDCNARDTGTHIASKPGEEPAPFDRIFLPINQPETRASCQARSNGDQPLDFKIIQPGEWIANLRPADFRKRVSDHLMVRFGLCVGKDDD